VLAEQGQLVGEERPVQEGHNRLGPGQREGTQARALSPGEDDRLGPVPGQLPGDQGWASSMSMTGIPSRIG
jgi:hypothetical protein